MAAYYAAQYPDLPNRPLTTRLLSLAATDTFVRYGVETFAEIADRYDVYLAAGASMPTKWKMVCASRRRSARRPAPALRRGEPAQVAILRDPDEPARDYAYEATTDRRRTWRCSSTPTAS